MYGYAGVGIGVKLTGLRFRIKCSGLRALDLEKIWGSRM